MNSRHSPEGGQGRQNQNTTPLFALLLTSQALAAAGETATLTALTVTLQSAGGTSAVTALIAASFLPAILLVAPTAALFRNHSPATVLALSCAGRIALTLALILALNQPIAIIVAYAVVRCVSVPENPAVLALAPQSAPPTWKTQTTYARLAAGRNIGAVAGPAFAGILLASTSAAAVIAFDALATATLLIAAVALRRSTQAAQKTHGRANVRHLLVRSAASPYVVGLTVSILFTAALPVAQAAFFLDERHTPEPQYGLIISAYAAGRLAAALIGSVVAFPRPASIALATGTIAIGAGIATATLFPAAALALFALAGYGNTLQVLSIRTIVHDATPVETIPQAFTSLGAINNAATLAGILVGGVVVGAISGAATLQLAGILTVAVGLVLLAARFRTPMQRG